MTPATLRDDFPCLLNSVRGKRLAYLDSAASAQKPRQVLDAMRHFYENDYANIHRGAYQLSQRATEAYENARARIARFIGAGKAEEIVFTRGATEGVNLVAATWGRQNLRAGDEVVLTQLEHHANIVPWQMLREEKGIELKIVPVTPDGTVLLEDVRAALSARTKLVATAHVSNVLGTILPVQDIARIAHEAGALYLVDGCQAVPHLPVDVRALGADFYVFSGHKIYGPTGIGALYGRLDLLNAMPPYQGGGDMIESVTFAHTTYREAPWRFEAGTPAIAQAVGLAAAMDYVEAIGFDPMIAHEKELLAALTEGLRQIEGVTLVGTAPQKTGIVSFTMKMAHPHDIGTILDSEGVAIRTGHHCAQPLMDYLGIPATARASLGLYNTIEDVEAFLRAVHKVEVLFK